MSTQPFGQPPAFGAAPAPVQQAPVAEPPKSGRTVLIAVAAGVVALGVLGGAAALVLSGGDDTVDTALPPASVEPVEPTTSPTTAPATPLPTAAVQGRNVFVPLVEGDDAAAGGGDTVADPQPPVATSAPTTAPIGSLPLSPLPAPAVTVTETVQVPGPTTTVPGPTTTVPGPTETVEVVIPGADFGQLGIQVNEVVDAGSTTYPATFSVKFGNDDPLVYADQLPFSSFGPTGNEFTYMSYEDGLLSFRYVSSVLTVQVPVTPAP
jgi:hypothetical protein